MNYIIPQTMTPILIYMEEDEPIETTMEALFAEDDGLTDADKAEIRSAVLDGSAYIGGGGAAPTFVIRGMQN